VAEEAQCYVINFPLTKVEIAYNGPDTGMVNDFQR